MSSNKKSRVIFDIRLLIQKINLVTYHFSGGHNARFSFGPNLTGSVGLSHSTTILSFPNFSPALLSCSHSGLIVRFDGLLTFPSFAAVAPAGQNVPTAAFLNAKSSPLKQPSSAILSASRSPSKKSPQIIPSAREGYSGFVLQTMPAYRPAADPAQELGLPVYRVTGKYNLPSEQRSWGFERVAADECFDNYSWWWGFMHFDMGFVIALLLPHSQNLLRPFPPCYS